MGIEFVVIGLLVAGVGVLGYPFAEGLAWHDKKYGVPFGYRMGDVEPESWRIKLYRYVLGFVVFLGLFLAGVGVSTMIGSV